RRRRGDAPVDPVVPDAARRRERGRAARRLRPGRVDERARVGGGGAGMSTLQEIKSRGTVTIDVEAWKGCELCIVACPPRVLEMSTAVNELGVRYPLLHPGCTGCAACLMVCP